jgi:2,3-bisphosphoglycerate-independent phosphoglycerate mutase
MKYLVILGDGMADRPIESLGGRTPLEYAKTPKMDELAAKGEIGMVHTIPDGMKPGSCQSLRAGIQSERILFGALSA